METKICPMCKDDKEISLFPIVNKKTGKIIYCKECKKKYDRDWWVKVKDKRTALKNKQATARRIRNRIFVIGFLKKCKCADCGIADWRVLEFDHKIRKDKSFNMANCSTQSIEKLQKEIDKCEVVCANCHNIRTIIQRGYYKYIEV